MYFTCLRFQMWGPYAGYIVSVPSLSSKTVLSTPRIQIIPSYFCSLYSRLIDCFWTSKMKRMWTQKKTQNTITQCENFGHFLVIARMFSTKPLQSNYWAGNFKRQTFLRTSCLSSVHRNYNMFAESFPCLLRLYAIHSRCLRRSRIVSCHVPVKVFI